MVIMKRERKCSVRKYSINEKGDKDDCYYDVSFKRRSGSAADWYRLICINFNIRVNITMRLSGSDSR